MGNPDFRFCNLMRNLTRVTGMTGVTRVTWMTNMSGTTELAWITRMSRMTGKSWMGRMSGMTSSLEEALKRFDTLWDLENCV